MPRKPRKISKTCIYHIICRGNNKSDIFLDDDDYIYFLGIIERIKKENKFFIYAYCLMKNHYHLLVYQEENSISKIMHKINTSFAKYINKKYKKTGHLFQDRFRSEAVQDDNYLLTVTRYIHNNPVKAEIVKSASDYKWSSYREYIGKRGQARFSTPDFVLKYFSCINSFINFSEVNDEKTFQIKSIQDAENYIKEYMVHRSTTIKKLKKNIILRNKLIKELKQNSKLPLKILAKILDVNYKVIWRA